MLTNLVKFKMKDNLQRICKMEELIRAMTKLTSLLITLIKLSRKLLKTLRAQTGRETLMPVTL